MRQVLALMACSVLLVASTSPVQAKPMHDVPYDPLPASVEELPQGGPMTLPWWQAGVLHLDGRTIETRFRRIAHRNGTTVVGKGSGYPGSRTEWYLAVRNKKLKPLVTRGTVRIPTISANGRWIAWLKETELSEPEGELGGTDTLHELVVYDAQERKVVDTYRNRRTVYDDGVNGMGMWGLDNRGRVALGINGQNYIWRPGHRLVMLKGRAYDNYLDLDSWPRGIMQFARLQDAGLYGTVDRKGRFDKQGLVRDIRGVWSADGGAYVHRTAYGAFWVDRIDDGLRVQLGVPEFDYGGMIGWESDTSVVVWGDDPDDDKDLADLMRCDAVTGDCERVPDGPVAGTAAEMQE
jgi:hypothetical protein